MTDVAIARQSGRAAYGYLPVRSTRFGLSGVVATLALASGLPVHAADQESTWDSTTNNWSDPSHWTTVPTAGLFPNNNGQTFDAIINGGTVTLDQDIEIDNLTLTGGNIAGDFKLTLQGPMSVWGDGIQSGDGTTVVASGSTLELATGGNKRLRRLLDNSGIVNHTQGNFFLETNGNVINRSGGVFNSLIAETILGPGANVFDNAGTFNTSGDGTTDMRPLFNNSGIVDVQEGLLIFNRSTHTGTSEVKGVGTFDLRNGTNTFEAGSKVTVSEVVITSGQVNVDGDWSPGHTVIAGGFLNLNSNASESLTQNGGFLQGSGTFTYNVPLSAWNDGTQSGDGTTVVATGSTLELATGGNKRLQRVLDNSGTITHTLGNFILEANGHVINRTGGVFNAIGAESIGGNRLTNTFDNAGTFNKTGAGTTDMGPAFNNSGTVDIQEDLLIFNDSTHTGMSEVKGVGTLDLRNGTHTFEAGSKVTVSEVVITSGQVNVDGDWSPGHTVIAGGFLNLNSNASESLTQNGGFLQGSGTFTYNVPLSAWNDGTQSGDGTTVVATGSTLELATGGNKRLQRVLDNSGTITHTLGNFILEANGHVINRTGGVFNAIGAESIGGNRLTNTFDNAGTFNKTGAGTTDMGPAFNNSGTVDIQEDLLIFNDSTHTGMSEVKGVGTLDLRNGTHTFEAGSQVTVAQVVVMGETVNVDGDWSPGHTTIEAGFLDLNSNASGSLTQNGGFLQGSGTFTYNVPLSAWNDGVQSGDGTTKIASGSTLKLATGGNKRLRRLLDNSGNVVHTLGNFLLEEGGIVINRPGGVFSVVGGQSIGGSSSTPFNNEGTFVKTGAGATTVGSPFNNSGSVDVQEDELHFSGGFIQTSGTTKITSGTLSSNTALDIQGGSLIGSGNVNADIDSAGVIAPGFSAGSFTIDGDLNLLLGSELAFEIGGTVQGTEYDFVDVNGDVSLEGMLTLTFLNGFEYLVSDSDTFILLTADSDIIGSFNNVASGDRLLTADGLGSFVVHYGVSSPGDASQLVLGDFQLIPEPTTFGLLALSSGGLIVRRRRRA